MLRVSFGIMPPEMHPHMLVERGKQDRGDEGAGQGAKTHLRLPKLNLS